jgi:hypothetical protein
MLNLENKDKFGKVIAGALAKVKLTVTDAPAKKCWINAISKAVFQIDAHNEFMTYNEAEKSLAHLVARLE